MQSILLRHPAARHVTLSFVTAAAFAAAVAACSNPPDTRQRRSSTKDPATSPAAVHGVASLNTHHTPTHR